eukprot:1159175-Pelagomonas_calceolata.AAC.20
MSEGHADVQLDPRVCSRRQEIVQARKGGMQASKGCLPLQKCAGHCKVKSCYSAAGLGRDSGNEYFSKGVRDDYILVRGKQLPLALELPSRLRKVAHINACQVKIALRRCRSWKARSKCLFMA